MCFLKCGVVYVWVQKCEDFLNLCGCFFLNMCTSIYCVCIVCTRFFIVSFMYIYSYFLLIKRLLLPIENTIATNNNNYYYYQCKLPEKIPIVLNAYITLMYFTYIISWNIRRLTQQAIFYFLFTNEHTQNVILCLQVYLHKNTPKISNSQNCSKFIDRYCNHHSYT